MNRTNKTLKPPVRVKTKVAATVALLVVLAAWWGTSLEHGDNTPADEADGGSRGANPRRPAAKEHTNDVHDADATPAEALQTSGHASAAAHVDPSVRAHVSQAPTLERAVDTSETWRLLFPGLCPEQTRAELTARTTYLATFREIPLERANVHNARLWAAPDTTLPVVRKLVWALSSLGSHISETLALEATPPTIYLHASLEAMHAHACVHPSALAYYDGAIHIAYAERDDQDNNLWPYRSLRHEYTHHVLMTSGIGAPLWFQESVAMAFAHEHWPIGNLPEQPIPIEDMVGPLDHGAGAGDVEALYAQAYVMRGFLIDLCRGADMNDRQRARVLREGQVHPEDLFWWSAEQCAGDLRVAVRQLWIRYWNNGRRLDDEITRIIRAR